MIEENKKQTNKRNGADANTDPTTETSGVLVAGPEARSRVEEMDPAAEDAYWQTHYAKRPYVDRDTAYGTYQLAYQTGYEGRIQYPGKKFEEVENDLRGNYEKSKGSSTLTWDKARNATRDAWNRVEIALPGGADGDGS